MSKLADIKLPIIGDNNPKSVEILNELRAVIDQEPQLKHEYKLGLSKTSPDTIRDENISAVQKAETLATHAIHKGELDETSRQDFIVYVAIANATKELEQKGYLTAQNRQYDHSIIEKETLKLGDIDLVKNPPIALKDMPKPTRLFVNIQDKEEVKALGAKWNNDDKFWYAPKEADLSKFEKWLYSYDDRYKLNHIENFTHFLKQNGIDVEAKDIKADGKLHFIDENIAYQLDLYDLNHVKGFTQKGAVGKEELVNEYNASFAYDNSKAGNELRYYPPINWDERRKVEEAQNKIKYDEVAEIAKAVISVAPKATEVAQHPYLVKKGLQGDGLYIVPSQKDIPPHMQDKILIAENPYLGKQNVFEKQRQISRYNENLQHYNNHINSLKAQGIDEKNYPPPPIAESLVNKQLLIKGDLLVPSYNKDGELRNLQYIHESSYFSKKENRTVSDNSKFYLNDGQKKGANHYIGNVEDGKPVAIVEGWATGKAVYDNFKIPVVVAFDTSGLEQTAKDIRERLPQSRVYFFADNDWQTGIRNAKATGIYKNSGVDKATHASKQIDNAFVIIPRFNNVNELSLLKNPYFDINDYSIKEPNRPPHPLKQGTDWDDLIRTQGVQVAKAQVQQQVKEINDRYGKSSDYKPNEQAKVKETDFRTLTIQGTTERPDPNINPIEREFNKELEKSQGLDIQR